MKRIYLSLGVLTALGFGLQANAQTTVVDADVAGVVEMDDNTCLNDGQMLDTTTANGNPIGIWGMINNGPDAIPANYWYIYQDATMPTPGGSLGTSYSGGQLTADANAGDFLTLSSFATIGDGSVDGDIQSLLDIDAFQASGSLDGSFVDLPDLVEGQTYGFYIMSTGAFLPGAVSGGQIDLTQVGNDDSDTTNNLAYVPVIWHCNATGIHDLVEEGARHIKVYPNPAQNTNTLNFEYGFIQNTKGATARVIDMMGRVVLTQELGDHSFGTEKFNMDISSLNNGNYILEISTGYINGLAKFTVVK